MSVGFKYSIYDEALCIRILSDVSMVDDSLLDTIDVWQKGKPLRIQNFSNSGPVALNFSKEKLSTLKLTGLYLELRCKDLKDEMFSGWDTLKYLSIGGGNRSIEEKDEYPIHLANHKGLVEISVNGWGMFDSGKGFHDFIEDFRKKGGIFTQYC
jgi:hypothetical protein